MITTTESGSQTGRSAGHPDGIRFTVTVQGAVRRCMVTRDALLFIARVDEDDADLLALFRDYEFRIYRLARMLVAMGIKGSPLILGPWSFRIDALTFKGKDSTH